MTSEIKVPPAAGTGGVLEKAGSLGGLLTASAGILAAVGYVVMSLAAERVYGQVDVSPTEVGLGYADLLAASASVLLLIVFPFLLAVLAAFRFPGTGGGLMA